jgi:hypothetical protein
VVVALMGLALTASAHQGENYKDKFTSISWWGSDGSLSWPGPWNEIGDDGDEKKGNVRVVSSGNCASGNCLWIGALTTLLGQIGAERYADTSGFEDLALRFDLCSTASLLGSEIEVQVTNGSGWVTVAEYELSPGIDVNPTIDISGYRSESFGVRFMFSGLLLSSEVYIDNIEIMGGTAESSSTTTIVAETTTTTAPEATTTTQAPATTTTKPRATTTTTDDESSGGDATTTTTTPPTSTTFNFITDPDRSGNGDGPDGTTPTSTTVVESVGAPESSGGGGSGPDGGGIRAAARGLQANFQGDLYGEVRSLSSLNKVDFRADYNMAVEVIEASWVWIAVLGLVVAYAIVSGLDKRRGELDR